MSEVHSARGAMTCWHRHERSQYLFANGGHGVIAHFDGAGARHDAAIVPGGTTRTPARTCHRHGADGRNETVSQVDVTMGATYWDDCHREHDTDAAD